MMFYLMSVIFCISLLAISAPLLLQAQESTGIKVQPAIMEERVDPGQTFSSILRATNLSSETKTFYILKRNISHLSPEGRPVFAEEGEETGFEISSWIRIDTDSVVIAGGETKEIPFSIVVPENAGPGGHFGGIFLSFRPERPEETGAAVGYEVGMIINLRTSGEVFEEARIREFRTDKTIYGKPKVIFITQVENIGNVLIRPRGPLEITNFFGKKVADLRINDEAAAVFPGSIRQFETSWDGEETLAFGRYQVVMSLVYGQEGRKTISRTLSFWILPMNIIVPTLGGTLALILGVFILVKLHIRKKMRQIYEATENTARSNPKEQELLYRRKNMPFSRLALISIILLIFTFLFLIVLFLSFA